MRDPKHGAYGMVYKRSKDSACLILMFSLKYYLKSSKLDCNILMNSKNFQKNQDKAGSGTKNSYWKRGVKVAVSIICPVMTVYIQYAYRLFHEPNFLRTEPKVR